MHVWALIVAAGQGSRLAGACGGLPKQFLPLEGAPLFWSSARVFARVPGLRGIVFILPPQLPEQGTFETPYSEWMVNAVPPVSGARECSSGRISQPSHLGGTDCIPAYEQCISALDAKNGLGLPWRVVCGGERRQDSVAAGLHALPHECDAVLVHDGARPFVSPALVARVLEKLHDGHAAVIPGVAVTDTVKEVDERGMVATTPDRERLRAVQTPQGFLLPSLLKAHAQAREQGWEATDDAALLERYGVPVRVIQGDERNRKITSPHDLELLRPGTHSGSISMTSGPGMIPCSGFGYDVHKYGGNRPFLLGGVPVACDVRVSAHSDGDTLLHALMDGMLGCIGAGDIGVLFPDTDPTFDNISSGVLLSEVLERCRAAGLVITHIDITVVAQTPRIAPHRQAIAANVAKLLQMPQAAVNIKATTEEGLGFTGGKKGLKVMALVTGLRPVCQPE